MKRGNRGTGRAWIRQAKWTGVGALLVLVGCGDDVPGPGGASLSVVGISQEIQALQTLAQLNDAFNSLGDLSNTIAPVMGPANPVPSIVPRGRPEGAERLERSSLSFRLPPTEPARLAANIATTFLRPPLGLTCIWAGQGWGLGSDIFGPVPQDQTFFELYETGSSGLPADPPVPLSGSAFVSVRPGAQSPASTIDVGTFVEQGSTRLLDATVQGTVTGPNVFDFGIEGGRLTDGTNALDFGLSAEADSRFTDLDFSNLSISESVTLDATSEAWNVSVSVVCSTCDSDNVSFDFTTTTAFPFTILSGDVFVDDQSVAQLGGSLASPNATVSGGLSESEASLLEAILVGVTEVTSGIALLAEFEACVASGSDQFCSGL